MGERVSVTVRLSADSMKWVRELALKASTADHRVTASDVIRQAIVAGLPAAKKELGQ